jgi:hypothetical protein
VHESGVVDHGGSDVACDPDRASNLLNPQITDRQFTFHVSSFTPEVLLADSAWLRRLTRRLTADAEAAADLRQDLAVAALCAAGR